MTGCVWHSVVQNYALLEREIQPAQSALHSARTSVFLPAASQWTIKIILELFMVKYSHTVAQHRQICGFSLQSVAVAQHVYSKCLLCPPGDADWSLGPGWTSEQAGERMIKQESERARKRRSDTGRKQGTSLPDAHWCRDRPNPWPEHTLLPCWGVRSLRKRGKTRSWGQRSGGRETALFLFLSVSCDDKNTTVWTRERTTKTTEHLTGRLMARQTGRWDERVTSHWGKKWLTFRRVDNIYMRLAKDMDVFVFGLL